MKEKELEDVENPPFLLDFDDCDEKNCKRSCIVS
jgi:hypothetical protein